MRFCGWFVFMQTAVWAKMMRTDLQLNMLTVAVIHDSDEPFPQKIWYLDELDGVVYAVGKKDHNDIEEVRRRWIDRPFDSYSCEGPTEAGR